VYYIINTINIKAEKEITLKATPMPPFLVSRPNLASCQFASEEFSFSLSFNLPLRPPVLALLHLIFVPNRNYATLGGCRGETQTHHLSSSPSREPFLPIEVFLHLQVSHQSGSSFSMQGPRTRENSLQKCFLIEIRDAVNTRERGTRDVVTEKNEISFSRRQSKEEKGLIKARGPTTGNFPGQGEHISLSKSGRNELGFNPTSHNIAIPNFIWEEPPRSL
jgi:hypothetical protein